VECGSLLLLAGWTRSWRPLAVVGAERDAVRASPKAYVPGRGAVPDFMKDEIVHPYLGSVLAQRTPEDDYGFGLELSPLQRRSPDKLIVAATGGSLAFMTFRDARALIEQRLRSAPRFAGREVVLLPLALPGHKQPQQLMALSYLLALGAEFDVVVNLDGYNEVALPAVENVAHGVFPAFPRLWSFRIPGLASSASLRGLGAQALLETARAEAAVLSAEAPWRYSPTASLLWRSANRFLLHRLGRERLRTALEGSGSRSFEATGPARRYSDEGALHAELAALWMQSSLLMHQLCRANGIEYLHFLQPNQYLPGSKPLSVEERIVARRASDYARAVELGYPRLVEAGRALAARGVRFHDLTRLFAEVEATLYVDSCCHVNAEGSRRIGSAIAEALAQ
jgi:hypothetical protein